MTTAEQHDEDRLVAYVSRALEMRERGEEPQLEELCREHPELIDRVAEVLGGAPRLAKLAVSANEFDGLAGRLLEGRYRLDARLGAGSMGIVYRAFDTKLSRSVAVKVLRPELFGGRDAEQRFLREAEVLATLRHPNVVAVHDRGRTSDGVSYLVMELLSGQPLVALLTEHERLAEANGPVGLDDMSFVVASVNREGQFEQTWLRQAVRWTADLARGLGEAHRLGILHRDVKPSNVFVGKDGRARLLDFGVASSAQHATLTAGNAALGTPGYMAPEVITEEAPASPATDVYGLGATLYHLLARRAPYLGTMTNIIASVQRRDPVPVGRLRPGLQRDLHAIVDKSMARNASERYATMAEFENDLRAFLNHQPVKARPLTTVARTWRNLRRSPLARALGVVLLVAALAASVAGVIGWRDTKRAREHASVLAGFPPGLGVELPELREIRDEAERLALRTMLDRAVATASEPLPTRMLRAAFALDQGDVAAAAEDMLAVAVAQRSDFSRALAERYRDAATHHGKGHSSLDLSDLPEPVDARDRYMASYHLARGGRGKETDERIIELLASSDPDWLPGQEMLVGALIASADRSAKAASPTEARDFCTKALQLISSVETKRGLRTAFTANQLGATLRMQQRIEDAVVVLSEGVELCPWSNGLLRNFASAQGDSGELESAIATCARAIKLRPSFIDNYRLMARLHAERGDYATSRDLVARAPLPSGPEGDISRQALIGLNECVIAALQLSQGNRVAADESARAGVQALDAVGRTESLDYAFARDLASNNPRGLLRALTRMWARDPGSWVASRNLAALLPTLRLSDHHVHQDDLDLLASGFTALSESQSPARYVSRKKASENPTTNLSPK